MTTEVCASVELPSPPAFALGNRHFNDNRGLCLCGTRVLCRGLVPRGGISMTTEVCASVKPPCRTARSESTALISMTTEVCASVELLFLTHQHFEFPHISMTTEVCASVEPRPNENCYLRANSPTPYPAPLPTNTGPATFTGNSISTCTNSRAPARTLIGRCSMSQKARRKLTQVGSGYP